MARIGEFYGQPDQEMLSAETFAEAVDEYLDQLPGYNYKTDAPFKKWLQERIKRGQIPATVTIAKYRHRTPKIDANWLLEFLLEDMNEEYGDWEGNHDPTTPRMQELVKEFAQAFADEYIPFQCEQVESIEIDVLDWLKDS